MRHCFNIHQNIHNSLRHMLHFYLTAVSHSFPLPEAYFMKILELIVNFKLQALLSLSWPYFSAGFAISNTTDDALD